MMIEESTPHLEKKELLPLQESKSVLKLTNEQESLTPQISQVIVEPHIEIMITASQSDTIPRKKFCLY